VGFSLFKEHVSDLLFVEDGSSFPFKAISYGFHFNEFRFPPHLVSLCILSNRQKTNNSRIRRCRSVSSHPLLKGSTV